MESGYNVWKSFFREQKQPVAHDHAQNIQRKIVNIAVTTKKVLEKFNTQRKSGTKAGDFEAVPPSEQKRYKKSQWKKSTHITQKQDDGKEYIFGSKIPEILTDHTKGDKVYTVQKVTAAIKDHQIAAAFFPSIGRPQNHGKQSEQAQHKNCKAGLSKRGGI